MELEDEYLRQKVARIKAELRDSKFESDLMEFAGKNRPIWSQTTKLKTECVIMEVQDENLRQKVTWIKAKLYDSKFESDLMEFAEEKVILYIKFTSKNCPN